MSSHSNLGYKAKNRYINLVYPQYVPWVISWKWTILGLRVVWAKPPRVQGLAFQLVNNQGYPLVRSVFHHAALVLRRGLSLNWSSLIQLGLWSANPRGPPYLHPQHWDRGCKPQHLAVLHESEDLNSGGHVSLQAIYQLGHFLIPKT